MEEDIKYGMRHREVTLFLGIGFGLFTAISAVSFLSVFGEFLRSMPSNTHVSILIGSAMALLVGCFARALYLLWKHPPIVISGETLHVVDGMRRKDFRLVCIGGPIEESNWLGFSGLKFSYDGRRITCATRLLPPADRNSLRRRLATLVAANEALRPTGVAGG